MDIKNILNKINKSKYNDGRSMDKDRKVEKGVKYVQIIIVLYDECKTKTQRGWNMRYKYK